MNFKKNHACVLGRFSHVQLCNAVDCSLTGSFVHGESKQQQKRMPKGNSLNRKETIKKKNNLEYQEESNSRVSENMGKVNRSLEFYKLYLTVDEKIITSSDLVLSICVCVC